MDLATGAMGALLPKLLELLKEENKLQAGLRKDVEFLEREMRSMDAALRKVARVQSDQLDDQVKIWADDVKELSYEMEGVVDRFLERACPRPRPRQFQGVHEEGGKFVQKAQD
jgi:disease resistance protein RPM1